MTSVGTRCGGALAVGRVLVEGDDRERALGAPGRRVHDLRQLGLEEGVAGGDAAALHVGAVVGGHPREVRRAGGGLQVLAEFLKRHDVGRAVGGAVAHVLEVEHRLVVIPVIAVHGVVAGAVGGLGVRLPGLVRGVDFVTDVGRVDRVERVFLFRVVERDAEGGPAGEGEVVGVARVLFGVEVGQRGAVLPEAVEVRGLLDVADDVAVVLVLEVEEEDVLVARARSGSAG